MRKSAPFLDKVKLPAHLHDCWLWTGYTHKNGYGGIRVNQKQIKTHRYSYTLYRGPIPPGLLVLHSCDVRNCVNPRHLFLGTQKDNVQDMMHKGRAKFRKHNLPEGVTPARRKFKACKNRRYIGTFETAQEAYKAFIDAS